LLAAHANDRCAELDRDLRSARQKHVPDAERIRLAAFDFLARQSRIFPDTLPWRVLSEGFQHEGRRIPILGPQGIFKPAGLRLPLSITTAPIVPGKERPYDDEIGSDDTIRYRYRGTDPNHRDNVGLRNAMLEQVPLVYLHGVASGECVAAWPVYVVADDPRTLTFTIAVGSRTVVSSERALVAEITPQDDLERRYATRTVIARLHQQSFRVRVLAACRQRCAVCRLRQRVLLDAAHILPDGHPRGRPVVSNGLALCMLHHAAFDRFVLGVRPDLRIEVRRDVLEEEDGPMLEHGLQGFHGAMLIVPRAGSLQPNREYLAERYEIFQKAS
jgi:putative restriction endonuclease